MSRVDAKSFITKNVKNVTQRQELRELVSICVDFGHVWTTEELRKLCAMTPIQAQNYTRKYRFA